VKKLRKIGFRSFQAAIAIILFLLLWEVVGQLGIIGRGLFLPPFSVVMASLWELAITGDLWKNASVSLSRALFGFALGLVVAIPLGLILGWFKALNRFLNPLLQVFRNLPILALLPVFVMFLGIKEASKVAIIFWAVIWAVFISTAAGVKSVDPLLIKAARSMGTKPVKLFTSVILPGALPLIFTGIRLAATNAILILVAAEMIGATKGLGYALYFYQQNMKIPEMYAYLVVMALIGVIVNGTLEVIERRSFRWRDGFENQ
jgi:NitT/TauT family transport system permease protein